MDPVIRISDEVRAAVAARRPVVALESTIFTHGLPRPRNVEVALEAEEIVRAAGVVPATIGLVGGVPTVGLSTNEIVSLSNDDSVVKVSLRDVPVAAAKRLNGGTTVAATAYLAARAGVSRATFYQHFESKQDIFMAGYAVMQGRAIGAIFKVPAAGTPMQRFGFMLHRYLGFMALDPPRARLYLLEVYAAGPDALRRRMELQEEFVAGVAKVFTARSNADRFACQALVAAVSMLVTTALVDADSAAILALEKPVLQFAERALISGHA